MVYYYETSDSHLIYVGKDKFENEDLLKWAFDEDVWFHVDNLSSAHVYLRLGDSESIESVPNECIEECAILVKKNSIEGCKKEKVDVCYTPWTNLRNSKSTEVGQVAFNDEKFVFKTKATKEKSKCVLPKLSKTMRDVPNPDLENERRKYDLKKKKEKKEWMEKEEARRKREEAEMRADLAARDYKLLDLEDKKTTNKALAEKYTTAEEAEDDFM